MNPGTAIMMLILASILNFGILHFLTTNIAPIHVIKGKIGKVGQVGLKGELGKYGNQGIDADRSLLGKNDKLLGDKGIRGEKGINADCNIKDKYCINENQTLGTMGLGSHMNLTGYRARNLENVCLFGYKPVVQSGKTICESPILGNKSFTNCPVGKDNKCITHKVNRWNSNITDKSSVYYFNPDSWVPDNQIDSQMNCSYKKEEITKMTPAQFASWTRLLANRDCPGVPHNGTKIPPQKDNDGNLIWPNPPTCIQQIKQNVGIGYYTKYTSQGEQCIKAIVPIGGSGKLSDNTPYKLTTCDCKPYPKKELGEECIVNRECNGANNVCVDNRCIENCSRYNGSKELGTENTDPTDNLSQYKCYKVLGSQCSSNTQCSSGECANSKCVEICSNNKMTPYEFNGIYDEDVYVDQPFDLNSYGSELRGTAYKCFNNPTPAPTPAPSQCPMGYPDTSFNRRTKQFNSCPTGRLNLPDSKITAATSEETSITTKNVNTSNADDVYIGANVSNVSTA